MARERTRPEADLLEEARAALSRDPGRARELAEEVLAEGGLDPTREAAAYVMRGNSRLYLADLERAREDFRHARKIYLETGQGDHALQTYLGDLNVLHRQYRFEEAERLLGQVQESVDALDSIRIRADFAEIRFLQYAMAERLQEALTAGRKAEALVRSLGDPIRLAGFLQNRANPLMESDRFDDATRDLQEVIGMLGNEDHPIRWYCENSLANICLRKGDLSSALQHTNAAVRDLSYQGLNLEDAASFLLTRGEILLDLGSPTEALDSARRAREMLGDGEAPRLLAETLELEGRSRIRMRDPMAESSLAAAADAYQQLSQPLSAGRLQVKRAAVLLEAGRAAEALAVAWQAQESLRNHRRDLLRARIAEAEALTILGDPGRARSTLSRVRRTAMRHGLRGLRWPLSLAEGRAAEAAGASRAARAAWERAAADAESVRSRLADPLSRLAVADHRAEPFERLLALSLQARRPDPVRIFEAAERGRARVLLDLIASQAGRGSRGGVEMVRKLEQVRDRFLWTARRAREAQEKGVDPAPLRSRMASLEAEASHLLRSIGGRLPVTESGGVDIDGVRAHLGSNTGLVEYILLEEQACALLLTRQSTRLVNLPLRIREIWESADDLAWQMDSLQYSNLDRQVEREIEAVLDPLRSSLIESLGVIPSELLLVPHGPLHAVPLEAMLPAGRAVSILPAASFLPLLSERHAPANAPLLSVGHAGPLAPGAEVEAREVAAHHPRSVLLAGEDATRVALAEHSTDAGILHLAGHLEHHHENPLFSALHLADGPLTPLDLRSFDLPGSLVYLSACSTGSGPVARSDDVLAFHRAFLAAGARSVVATLWPVKDEPAREMARVFHGHLAEGESPATSLALARGALRDAGAPLSHWASHRLLGPA